MIEIENDYISSEYRFKDDNCNPKHNIKVSLGKQKEPDNSEYFTLTVWGNWGELKTQYDLSFKSKNECIKFINEMSKVVKTDFKG